MYLTNVTGSEFGNKNSQKSEHCKKSEHSKDNSPPQAKFYFIFFLGGGGGVVKHFNWFAKGIYETFNRNFFNLAIAIVVTVFSIVQFTLFLRFASSNQQRTMKNFRIPGGVKFFCFNVTPYKTNFKLKIV